MAIQHEIEALIVDTPLHEYFKQFGIKPQIENKEKIMPPVLTFLVDKDIIELFEETRTKKKLKISKDIQHYEFELTCYRRNVTVQITEVS